MNYAIVLAGGTGKRMGLNTPKQFLEIEGKPVLFYSMSCFNRSKIIDEIILVSRGEDFAYWQQLIDCEGLNKVKHLVQGGKERYDSVMNGLSEVTQDGYVFIHDGARPCITEELIEQLYDDVKSHKAVVTGVTSKDTVRIVDDNGFSIETPDRNRVRIIQTPQVFDNSIIKSAYAAMKKSLADNSFSFSCITDDGMVVEKFSDCPVYISEGNYANIKLTTMEDLPVITGFFKKNKKN